MWYEMTKKETWTRDEIADAIHVVVAAEYRAAPKNWTFLPGVAALIALRNKLGITADDMRRARDRDPKRELDR